MNMNFISNDDRPSSFQIVKSAFLDANKHFYGLVWDISFSLFLFICMFVPLWASYINSFGQDHFVTVTFKIIMNLFLYSVIYFMVGFYLFNRTHPDSKSLKFWEFIKEVSWPWVVEGLKASFIMMAGYCVFIIPGIIKSIHYIFVGFVVCFNPAYKEGKINALKHSKKLTKGLGLWIFFLFIVCPLLIELIPDIVAQVTFQQTGFLWIVYPILMLGLYIKCLALTYLFSILYSMYTLKDQIFMIKDHVKGEVYTDTV